MDKPTPLIARPFRTRKRSAVQVIGPCITLQAKGDGVGPS